MLVKQNELLGFLANYTATLATKSKSCNDSIHFYLKTLKRLHDQFQNNHL